jgi:hypothetical protein
MRWLAAPCNALAGGSCDALAGGPCDALAGKPCDELAGGPCDALVAGPCDALVAGPCNALNIAWPGGIERHYENGRLHREEGPAVVIKGTFEAWYRRGDPHRIGEAADARDLPRMASIKGTGCVTVGAATLYP